VVQGRGSINIDEDKDKWVPKRKKRRRKEEHTEKRRKTCRSTGSYRNKNCIITITIIQ